MLGFLFDAGSVWGKIVDVILILLVAAILLEAVAKSIKKR